MIFYIILVVQAILLILACFAMMEHKAEEDIGKKLGFDIRPYIMPKWVILSTYLGFVSYGLALYTFINYSGIWALAMVVAYFLIPNLMPVPASSYERVYKGIAEYCAKNSMESKGLRSKLKATGLDRKIKQYK